MVKPTVDYINRIQVRKTGITDRMVIYAVRAVSNYFWVVVDILSHDNRRIAAMYEKSIGTEYKNECKELDISKGKHILHIGCGSYPLTEMTIARLFNVKIVGIDKNPRAVQRARDVVQRNKLEKKITIEQGNGAQYPIDTFDMIIVSTCALPKSDILDHIFTNAKNNSRIIIRDLDILTAEFLRSVQDNTTLIIKKRIHHPSPVYLPFGWDAIHLQKK